MFSVMIVNDCTCSWQKLKDGYILQLKISDSSELKKTQQDQKLNKCRLLHRTGSKANVCSTMQDRAN